MSIMTRLVRLCKADLHGVMDQLEDKELLLKQYLREMELALEENRENLRQLDQASNNIRTEIVTTQQEIDKLEQDVNLAIRKENDDIAKLLNRKQRHQQNHSENLTHHLATLEDEQKLLSDQIEGQRLKYETLKLKAITFYRKADLQRNHAAMASDSAAPPTVMKMRLNLNS